MTSATMMPFAAVRLRPAAAVLSLDGLPEVALIHRVKNGQDQYTLPGGNARPGEPVMNALRRELAEELRLHLDREPELIGIQDQLVTRPGPRSAPHKLHLVFRVPVAPAVRAAVAQVEHDDLGDGQVVWVPLPDVLGLHLFPDVGEMLAKLDPACPGGAVVLPPMTDDTFRWI